MEKDGGLFDWLWYSSPPRYPVEIKKQKQLGLKPIEEREKEKNIKLTKDQKKEKNDLNKLNVQFNERKEQISLLMKKREFMEKEMTEFEMKATEYLKKGQKDRALNFIRQKKQKELLIQTLDKQIINLETLQNKMDETIINMDILKQQKNATNTLKEVNSILIFR
jgi:hypothetical protein